MIINRHRLAWSRLFVIFAVFFLTPISAIVALEPPPINPFSPEPAPVPPPSAPSVSHPRPDSNKAAGSGERRYCPDTGSAEKNADAGSACHPEEDAAEPVTGEKPSTAPVQLSESPADLSAKPSAKPQPDSAPGTANSDDDTAPATPTASPAPQPQPSGPRVVLSDGTVLAGNVYLTTGAGLTCFRLDTNAFANIAIADILSVDCRVVRSETVYSYRFKEAGSNEKVKSGPGYVDQEYEMTVTLLNGKTFQAHAMGQAVYVDVNGKRYKYLLRKHQRGKPGQPASSIISIRSIIFHPQPQ